MIDLNLCNISYSLSTYDAFNSTQLILAVCRTFFRAHPRIFCGSVCKASNEIKYCEIRTGCGSNAYGEIQFYFFTQLRQTLNAFLQT